jgi:adenylate cyclase
MSAQRFLPDLKKWFESPPPEADLPQRVRQSIRENQDQSEMMIGWIQFTVVSIMGLLYLLSPKTFTEDAQFAPVPWALGIYLGLTVIRLIWGSLSRLPQWSLIASIFFDIGLLMVLIWSFHLQYDQPASFYLKAPTLLYVFIFIAMRALRMDPKMVLVSGVIAALGWGAMITYVILSNPEDTMITRDYVTYITSNAILLGAEFDKIISILMVTGILALALRRGQALLVRSVVEQQAAQRLSRFFDQGVAQQIAGGDEQLEAGQGQTREAAIVNLDMRGFTRLAEQSAPDKVMAVLAEYQQRMVPILQRHGGSIDKFMGDGIMATFGAAAPSETYAADALRAMDDCIEEAERWHEEMTDAGAPAPRVNAAAAHGRILFGAVGDDSRLEITVIGDAVNLSAKLEKHNKEEAALALCPRATFELALAQGYEPKNPPEQRAARRVAGVAEPLDLTLLATGAA